MKPATLSFIRQELKNRPPDQLFDMCLRMARFKKENKELLTYLLFEADDEQAYIKSVKLEMDEMFADINTSNIYFVKKSVRKILKITNKFIRYSGKKQTEVELLMHFCFGLKTYDKMFVQSLAMQNIYSRQIQKIKTSLKGLHEDLQFDYKKEMAPLL